MSTSSNHTKAFVQCCHSMHTVASSRTLLSDHVCILVMVTSVCIQNMAASIIDSDKLKVLKIAIYWGIFIFCRVVPCLVFVFCKKKTICFNSSYEEFLAQTQKPEFEKDSGWEGLDEQQIYSQDEYREFERKRQEEIQRLIAQGVVSYCSVLMPVAMACLWLCAYSALWLLQICRVKLSCYLC